MRRTKEDEMPYVWVFMLLYLDEKKQDGCHLMAQRSEKQPGKKTNLFCRREKWDEKEGILVQTKPPQALPEAP